MAKSQKNHDPFAENDSEPKKKTKAGVYDKGTPEYAAKHNIHNPELLSFVQRMERLKEDLQAVNDDIKELATEVKNRGFDVPIFKEVLKYRKDSKAYEEKIALVGTYVEGIGENFEIPGFYEQSLDKQADRDIKVIHDSLKDITAAGDVTITAGDKSATLKKEDFHQTDDEVFS
jgi:uncharacterized protein (UPF0335 family)